MLSLSGHMVSDIEIQQSGGQGYREGLQDIAVLSSVSR